MMEKLTIMMFGYMWLVLMKVIIFKDLFCLKKFMELKDFFFLRWRIRFVVLYFPSSTEINQKKTGLQSCLYV